jgi:hypothetical protein
MDIHDLPEPNIPFDPNTVSYRTRTVLKGFFELDHEEQQKFIDMLDKYRYYHTSFDELLINKVILGPVGSICPCCGK